MLTVAPVYIGAIAILMALLAGRTSFLRNTYDAPLGDGGAAALFLAQRRFGNLSEYAAVALLILVALELTGTDPFWLHIYGGSFLIFRLVHPFMLFDSNDAPLWQKAGRFVCSMGTSILLVTGGVALML